MIKLHPKLNTTFVADFLPEFVYDVSSHKNVNELLTVVDILITDYSSLPFEFALLNRPMIFYVPDLETYKQSPGLWEPLANNFPGPIQKIPMNLFGLSIIFRLIKKHLMILIYVGMLIQSEIHHIT